MPHDDARSEPRAAYVHVPFCRHRCGYCNFSLVAGRDDLIEEYLAALAKELSGLARPRPVETLFLGGGTPSHLPARSMRALLETVVHWFPLREGGEFTIEANPPDVTAERVAVWSEYGVTRLSLGGQSFDRAKLRLLERDHTAGDIESAAARARGSMRSVSLDLIFATPGETLVNWRADLASALRLGVDHVSTYGLTFERGTRYWSRRARGELNETPDDLWRAMYESAIDTLCGAGYEHYEVSNFARERHRCRHNEVYWAGEEYYAAGPGAARYVAGRREVNHRSTTTWMARIRSGRSPAAESEMLCPEDRARERLVLGLRTLRGIDPELFSRQTGYSVAQLGGAALEKHLHLGSLEYVGGRLRLSRAGLFVSDAIWPDFLRV